MAVKKSELYSSLWASCDALRGGMDASQYKDYILTLLFVKYVSDRYKGVDYPDIEIPDGGSFDDMVNLIGKKNIGEGINKVIAKLAEANNLRGIIDKVSFNDPDKLGKGEEMVDKLGKLINIFRRPELDFSGNRAEGDDLIGDAYEYLMRKFATESGKSKGQFYTPAEVSRILAKIIGISKEKDRNATIYDPACGSGSLLIRAINEAPFSLSGYGQEKDTTTAGLAKMNAVLHNLATAEIRPGNTFSDPQYFEPNTDNTVLRRFNYIVANPPFSIKNWTDGLKKEYGRFDGYVKRPPEKNGDYAWLMHILKSLKRNGKAAVILPHGVLFRENAEGDIREALIETGYIKGIIGLPANLFYGTCISACIIIIDKEGANERTGIFMIDASRDFVKDGNKNRLRERDVYKIVTTFNEQIIDDPHYARFVPYDEIKDKNKNNYNLNISRYIDSGIVEDLQSIDAHLNGGIPVSDIDSMEAYWKIFSELKGKLFSPLREGYCQLNVPKEEVRELIYSDAEFTDYAQKIGDAFTAWCDTVDEKLRNLTKEDNPKQLILFLSEQILSLYELLELIDKYDVYEVLMEYWQETMSDDVYLIIHDGYKVGRELSYEYATKEKEENGEKITVVTDKIKSWDGKLIPKSIIINAYFPEEAKAIQAAEIIVDDTKAQIDEMIESAEEGSTLKEVIDDDDKLPKALKKAIDKIRDKIETDESAELKKLLKKLPLKKKELEAYVNKHPLCELARNDKGNINKTSINARIGVIRETAPAPENDAEDYEQLMTLYRLIEKNVEQAKLVKDLRAALEELVKARYAALTIDEIKELTVNKKWYYSIYEGIDTLYEAVSHRMTDRILELAERYEDTLPALETLVSGYEAKVKSHLERMGFEW
ncbi:type I restriction enzyme M protein [Ruminococcaceae bacterium P7]|nr:type I restriction enzyme M protein [Ruminococcaceae bacterium P7]